MEHVFNQQQNNFHFFECAVFSPLHGPNWVLYMVFPLKLSTSLLSLPITHISDLILNSTSSKKTL